MTYCDQSDMITRFGEAELIQLTDRAGTGEIGSDTVDEAIDAAVADINSLLASRYALPLSSVPAVLKDKCEVVARYKLYKNGPTKNVRQDYEDAISWVKEVRDGKNSLGIESGHGADQPQVSARAPIYTDALMAKY